MKSVLFALFVIMLVSIAGIAIGMDIDNAARILLVVTALAALVAITFHPTVGIAIITLTPIIQTTIGGTAISSIFSPIVGFITLFFFFLRNKSFIGFSAGLRPQYVFGGLFIVWLFVTSPFSSTFTNERNWLFTYVQLFFLMWLAAELMNLRAQRWFMLAFMGATSVSVISSIGDSFISGSIHTSIRNDGLAGNANELAMYLVIAVMFAFYFMNKLKRLRNIIFSVIALPTLFFGLASTISRTGFVSLAVCLLFLTLLYPKVSQSQKISVGIIRMLSIVLVIAILVIVVIPAQYWQVVDETLASFSNSQVAAKDSFSKRLNFWDEALTLWQQSPIAGIGAGQFRTITDEVVHNAFLTILAENGFVGLILYGLWLVSIVSDLWYVIQSDQNPELSSIASIWFVSLIGFCILLLTNSFQYYKIVWFIAGISIYLRAQVQTYPSKQLAVHTSLKLKKE